jgi:hypothetical protein
MEDVIKQKNKNEKKNFQACGTSLELYIKDFICKEYTCLLSMHTLNWFQVR